MAHKLELYLTPVPKKLRFRDGAFRPNGKRYIYLEADEPKSLMPAVVQTALGWEVTASPKVPKEQVGLAIKLDESHEIPSEGYKLSITPDVMEIAASTPAGAFYGACTLTQILRSPEIPCLSVFDWPDLPARGVMLDVSRDKVPSMETLYHLTDLLSEWKINQFQLYTEHSFAYLAHPKVWEHASPMTGEEILALDSYCRDRFIELVPNQNSFGHFERWLKFDEYRGMAECPDGFESPWGGHRGPTTLYPLDKKNVAFLAGLYDELLPHFSSSLLNVGCDETWELGKGRSAKAAEKHGVGRVYYDFLMEIHRLVEERGRTMQFWGDIILHHPELIPKLPENLIALEWGYEQDHPFEERSAKFADSGIPFYVAPGTSSWNSLAGRTDNAIGNIARAAKVGFEKGAIGLLNTDWGDNGHWQPLPVSYLGYMAGAMASWNAGADVKKSLPERLSLHAFGDPTGRTGRAFYDIGNVYKCFGKEKQNCSVPWQILFLNQDNAGVVEGLRIREFEKMERQLKDIAYTFIGGEMTCPDADVVRDEFEHIVMMLQLAAEFGKCRLGGPKPRQFASRVDELKMEHELVWLLRNRPGGLVDSEEKMRADT